MSARVLLAALVVIAAPIAVQGAEPQTQPRAPKAKRFCEVTGEIGSRVRNIRRCRSAEEREAAKQEARRSVERIQNMKASMGR